MQVRSPFRPGQYPEDMQTLYATTPDEALPDFYTHATVFHASNGHMPDVRMPEWAPDVAAFLQLHRCAAGLRPAARDLLGATCAVLLSIVLASDGAGL